MTQKLVCFVCRARATPTNCSIACTQNHSIARKLLLITNHRHFHSTWIGYFLQKNLSLIDCARKFYAHFFKDTHTHTPIIYSNWIIDPLLSPNELRSKPNRIGNCAEKKTAIERRQSQRFGVFKMVYVKKRTVCLCHEIGVKRH